MTWKWDELTAPDFSKAVETAQGTCLVPLGVLEKHGDHLPLGTDVQVVTAVAERAVAREPAVLFPPFYFGQIHEARHCPGTLAIRHDLLVALLENVCEEIARNGMKKVVLLNGHGGNESLLGQFVFRMLERPRPFTVYVIRLCDYMNPVLQDPQWKAQMVSEFDHHGGEAETSTMLALRPERVRMDRLTAPGLPLRRLAGVAAATPVWWYADYPDHYAGDAAQATADKGAFLVDGFAQRVAAILGQIKRDAEAPALQEEFHRRTQHGRQ